ncbi:hypothetical protein M9H77_25646 [Catharanthus roseus]|uniref:Uncharacterized protein n=1 Tax=Catharanthus roseus TaxID=4058 RepID=A0ACC0AA25_CATRO|nr:hypothetical protein M9H77_25646 [Catharanthus roseus]
MEEVPAHIHSGPIVPDVLSRQHEHRSSLIWSGNHETQLCTAALGGVRQIGGALVLLQIWAWSRIPAFRPQLITDVQTDPLAPLGAIWCTSFDCSQLPTHTLLRENDNTYWGTQYASHVEEVDDMALVVIQEPPTDPSQMAVFAKKVHTIIQRCMISIAVKKGTRRQPGRRAGDGRPPVPPFLDKHEHVEPGHAEVEGVEGFGARQSTIDPFDSPNLDIPFFSLGLMLASQSLPSGSGTSQMPPPPGLGFASFQSPYSTSFGFSGFMHPLLRAQSVHLQRINLYRRNLHLMKRSRRMT